MALVTLKNAWLSYGGYPLFEDTDFQIDPKERVCLVGRNGTGKSTLLKVILGKKTLERGDLMKSPECKIAYLPQDVPDDVAGICVDVVANGADTHIHDAHESEYRAHAVITQLGLQPLERVESMSGGQKRRVLLARAIVGDPDLLLLDEPSNHLDIESIGWLENFLCRFDGSILFVSHDRYFLKKVATRIVDLDAGKLTSWPGNYERYLQKKEELLEVARVHNEKFEKKLAEEEAWIRQGIKARRTRNEGRVRNLLKLREQASQRRKSLGKTEFDIQEQKTRTSKRVVQLENATFSYGEGEEIINGLSTTIYRGDKVGIVGRNGCGKTTLIRLMLGELEPTQGKAVVGENLDVAYLDQLRDKLDRDKTVAENICDGDKVLINGQPKHVISYLRDFLFTADRAKSPVWVLSGGEKNRLLLAKLFTKPANVLVFDEPTNDLDTETLELLEDKIDSFSGTVLVVSHDREFLNNTVTGTLVFEEDAVREYAGGYDDWLAQRPQFATKEIAKEKKQKPRSKVGKRKLSYNETRELERLPGDIEQLETEQAELTAKMQNPAFFVNNADDVQRVASRLDEIEEMLMNALERWEQLESIKEGTYEGED
ncbi:MAG: ATP-binding cassette domain-containing protein [Deltaproteobacteria bacterium]|nr:ATP-binding cassette domain-containing protein [Deltaproteobacteria bacterium]MBN2670522.1 ATP-binding cassette domain-containing protein [Deltaproteobacteria bacterium]